MSELRGDRDDVGGGVCDAIDNKSG